MVKTVVNNAEVKHLWAQQTQERARGNGSTRFEGPTLYSYSTPIAHFYEHKGKRVALISSNSYSPSTARHMPHVSDIPPGIPAFKVIFIGVSGGRAPWNDSWIKRNFEIMAEDYKALIDKFSRARSDWKQNYYREEMGKLAIDAANYNAFFGLRLKVDKYFPPLNEATINAAKEKAAKACKAEEAAREKVRLGWQDAIKKFLGDDSIKFLPQAAYDAATGEQLKAIRDKAATLWRTRTIRHLPGDMPTLLRVNKDGVTGEPSEVETSRGATFPAIDALKVWKLIKRVKLSGSILDFHRPEVNAKFGGYPRLGESYHIDTIHADGSIRAGCHFIEYAEAERCARALGDA